MTTKIKTTLITVFFIFGLFTSIQAQDKYEYAYVTFAFNMREEYAGIYVTISGKKTEKVEVEIKKVNPYYIEYAPIMDYIQKMSDEGWELITIDDHVFYLKRKKN